MRRFLVRGLIFSIPLLLMAGAFFRYPVRREFAYHYNPGDCENRGAWLYERIFRDTTPIDVVFLGTSHTMTGIWDMQVESLLCARTGRRLHVANLGYCRNGEEIPYVLLKDVFRTKKPRLVVLEVRERVSLNSHPVYPFLAEEEDLLHPPSWLQQSNLPNAYDAWLVRLSAIRSDIFGTADTVRYEGYTTSGFRRSDHRDDPAALEKVRSGRQSHGEPLFRQQLLRYPLGWIERLEALAQSNGAQLCFVYMPSFGSPEKKPELQALPARGTFLLPPDSVLAPPAYWRDPDHLNNDGAKALSRWIAGKLPID